MKLIQFILIILWFGSKTQTDISYKQTCLIHLKLITLIQVLKKIGFLRIKGFSSNLKTQKIWRLKKIDIFNWKENLINIKKL